MIKALFTDLGGVLLTNGWDYAARQRAAEHFKLEFVEFEKRHQLVVGVYEEGRMDLASYLGFVVFHEQRSFALDDFYGFMKDQSQPFQEMLTLYDRVKADNAIQIFAVSNEGRDLAEHRVTAFNLKSLIDGFIVSAFVGARKPDPSIWRMTFDIAQVTPDDVLYIDDREMLVEAANKLGIPSYWHQTRDKTAEELARRGLLVH